MFTCVLGRCVSFQFSQYPSLSEGADGVGGKTSNGFTDKECPLSDVTNSGRVWWKVPENEAWSWWAGGGGEGKVFSFFHFFFLFFFSFLFLVTSTFEPIDLFLLLCGFASSFVVLYVCRNRSGSAVDVLILSE